MNEKVFIPARFDILIGASISPHPCRMARREPSGFGVEFLEPVRNEVAELLCEYAFKEELLFEAMNPSLSDEITLTKLRLSQAVNAIMKLIEGRNVVTWDYADVESYPIERMREALTITHTAMNRTSPAQLPVLLLNEEQDEKIKSVQ